MRKLRRRCFVYWKTQLHCNHLDFILYLGGIVPFCETAAKELHDAFRSFWVNCYNLSRDAVSELCRCKELVDKHYSYKITQQENVATGQIGGSWRARNIIVSRCDSPSKELSWNIYRYVYDVDGLPLHILVDRISFGKFTFLSAGPHLVKSFREWAVKIMNLVY